MTTGSRPIEDWRRVNSGAVGRVFINGQGMTARRFSWAEQLTVVRVDPRSYGVTRYIVRDRHGRHGFAY